MLLTGLETGLATPVEEGQEGRSNGSGCGTWSGVVLQNCYSIGMQMGMYRNVFGYVGYILGYIWVY